MTHEELTQLRRGDRLRVGAEMSGGDTQPHNVRIGASLEFLEYEPLFLFSVLCRVNGRSMVWFHPMEVIPEAVSKEGHRMTIAQQSEALRFLRMFRSTARQAAQFGSENHQLAHVFLAKSSAIIGSIPAIIRADVMDHTDLVQLHEFLQEFGDKEATE